MTNNTPRIRLDDYNGTWKSVKLNNIAQITMGQSPLSRNYTNKNNGITLVQSANDFQNGQIKSRAYTSQITKTANKGDILLTVRVPVGKVAINNKSMVVIGRGISDIRSPYNYFLYLIFNRMNYLNQWNNYCVGAGFFKSIKAKALRNVNVNLPADHQEQQAIESLFKHLDHLIDLQITKINIIKNIKAGWLQRIFSKDSQKSWHSYLLKDLLKIGKIGSTPSTRSSKSYNGKIPFLNITDLKHGTKSTNDIKQHISKYGLNHSSSWIVPKGAISLSLYGEIGVPVQITTPLATSQSFFSMVFKNNINTTFIYYLFQFLNINDAWFPYVHTSSTVKNLKVSSVKSLRISIPPLKTQQKIAKIFTQFDKVVGNNQKKLKLLKHFKNGCLQQMLC